MKDRLSFRNSDRTVTIFRLTFWEGRCSCRLLFWLQLPSTSRFPATQNSFLARCVPPKELGILRGFLSVRGLFVRRNNCSYHLKIAPGAPSRVRSVQDL